MASALLCRRGLRPAAATLGRSAHRQPLSASATAVPYTERMKAKGRPVSPHVTRYDFPIAALSSITQRVTGCALSVGLLGVAGVSLAGGDVGSIAATIAASPAAPAAKFVVAFPLTYHFLGAARHVVWDKMPEATLHNDLVAQSSWAVVVGSVAVSLGLAAVSLPAKPTTKANKDD